MHGTSGPFNYLVFAEAALVTGTWWAGITVLVRVRSITESVIGMVRGHRVCCIFSIVTWHESDAVLPRQWVPIVTTIIGVFLCKVSIIVALEKILGIFKGVHVEILFTVEHIVLDVFLGE